MNESDLGPDGVPEVNSVGAYGPFVEVLESRHREVELGVALLHETPHICGLGIRMFP